MTLLYYGIGLCGGMNLKQTEKIRLICRILFVVYLIILFYFLFFAEAMGRVSDSGEREYIYNLELFKEIRRFLEYRDILGWKAVTLNLAGNVVAFMPFGFFLPVVLKNCKGWFLVTLLTLTASLVIETIQLVTKVGSFDVDDILLNTLGGMIGYFCYFVIHKIRRHRIRKRG